MDAIEALMSYPLSEVFLIILSIVIALKFMWSLIDWFLEKFKKAFNVKTAKEKKDQEFKDTIFDMAKKIDNKEIQFTDAILTVRSMISDLKEKIVDLEKKEDMTQERIQQDARAYLIDKHKRYMSQGCIDVHTLENLEIRYMYYKAAGGNSFVDGLMTDLRMLPKASAEEEKEVKA